VSKKDDDLGDLQNDPLLADDVTDLKDDVTALSGDAFADADEPAVDELEETEEWQEESTPTYFDDVSDDSVRLYLREIGKIALLSAEEE